MFPSACSCFPPLAEGQSGRLGRRLYSRLALHRQTTFHGLSARVPRDSPEETTKAASPLRGLIAIQQAAATK